MGRPVATSDIPVPHPTEAQLADVLARWEVELRRLFDEHKDALLPPDVAARGLRISTRSNTSSGGSNSKRVMDTVSPVGADPAVLQSKL